MLDETLGSLSVALPSLTEQQHIVEKLDALLPKVMNAKERLQKIPILLKKFRQIILSTACIGKLTEDWRNGKELPDWKHHPMKEVTHFSQGIQVDIDKQYQDCNNDRIRFLRIIDFTQGTVQSRYVVKPEKKYMVDVEDISLVRYGASTGFVARGLSGCIANNLFRVIPDSTLLKEYLYFFLLSPLFQNVIATSMKGAAMPAISFGLIQGISVPVPSMEEQQEIVNRVDKLFTLADSLETKYKKAMARIEKIEQSVLAKAFRGEL